LVTGYADRQRSYYHAYFAGNALAGALLFGLLGGLVFGYAQLFPGASGDIDRLVVTAFCIFEPVTLIVLDQLQVARGGEALRRMNDLLARLAQVDTTDPIRVDATDPIRVDVTDPIRVDAADPIRVDVTDPIRVDAADPIRVDTTDTPAADPALPHSFSRIELRGVRYAHPLRGEGSGFAIGPIDLTVRPGELVLVTGRNGSGKSTFLRLLTGLYTADQGALVLDGEELSRPVPQRFREHFGVIFSDFVLFDRLYGLADVDPAAVRRLLGDMELDHAVGFAGGAFTTTTELSTGQRKRLAMVVALLDDRPIYVFDEWAADQDPEFRAAFYQRLLPSLVQRGKAVVVASHDDPFFATADRRIHFEAGVPTISGDGRPS
ncbi:MAG: ATP-binding cassette domain-containing protein, partial [Myxococcota bacterium]